MKKRALSLTRLPNWPRLRPPFSARRQRRFLVRLFVFVVDLLGVAVLFALVAVAAWYVYRLQVPG